MTKKQVLEKAKRDRVMDKYSRYVSAMYLLHSVSALMLNNTEEFLLDRGLIIGDVKWQVKKLNKAFDLYFEKVGKMVGKDQFSNLTEDMMEFEKVVKQFTKLDEI